MGALVGDINLEPCTKRLQQPIDGIHLAEIMYADHELIFGANAHCIKVLLHYTLLKDIRNSMGLSSIMKNAPIFLPTNVYHQVGSPPVDQLQANSSKENVPLFISAAY